MQQEFIELEGKIIVKKDWIEFRKSKEGQHYSKERFMFFLVLLVVFGFGVYRIMNPEDNADRFGGLVYTVLSLAWMWPYLKHYYILFFVKTWSNRIRMERVESVTLQRLGNGIETEVVLNLQNGRKKFVVFRDAENQLEVFLEAIKMGRGMRVE